MKSSKKENSTLSLCDKLKVSQQSLLLGSGIIHSRLLPTRSTEQLKHPTSNSVHLKKVSELPTLMSDSMLSMDVDVYGDLGCHLTVQKNH